jgi:2-keto-4-pentenoate hydratase
VLIDPQALAQELVHVYQTGGSIAPPSSRDPEFDLQAAYATEASFAALREQAGRKFAGWKVGYANKAAWRVLKLETLVWARMYDDTVHFANENGLDLVLPPHHSLKIEPEIVFRLKEPVSASAPDAPAALSRAEWLAIGFEIIDCPFPNWQFKPADFVAAFGLHRALIIGEPRKIGASEIPELAEQLASFKVKVLKDGEFIEEGSGRNSLRSPALCLAELGGAMLKSNTGARLSAGDLISSGTLTSGHAIQSGESWRAEAEGLPVAPLAVRFD